MWGGLAKLHSEDLPQASPEPARETSPHRWKPKGGGSQGNIPAPMEQKARSLNPAGLHTLCQACSSLSELASPSRDHTRDACENHRSNLAGAMKTKKKRKKKAQPLPLHSCTSRNLSFLVLKKIHSPVLPEYHRQRNQHIDYDPSWCISIRCINSAPASWKDNCYMLAES